MQLLQRQRGVEVTSGNGAGGTGATATPTAGPAGTTGAPTASAPAGNSEVDSILQQVSDSKEKAKHKVEFEVGELIPQKEWTNLSQRMIWHGRRICHSRKPACGACPLAKVCPSVGIGEMDPVKAALLLKTDKDFR